MTTSACFTPAELNPIAFMPDSTWLAIRSASGVQIFNLETLQDEAFLKVPLNVLSAALSPNGDTLAWSLEDDTIQLLRIADKELINTLKGHTDMVYKLRFSPDGERLYFDFRSDSNNIGSYAFIMIDKGAMLMSNDESQGGQLELPRHELIRVPRDNGTSPPEKVDEWYCPTCGRRIIIEYPPAYKKIVLEDGDQSVTHSGGKGGVEINLAQVSEFDPYLDVWQEWMDRVDFENHWEEDLQ